jgi:nucleoside 2-deoxyribosyltransferase
LGALLRIYFAGSIRGGRDDAARYLELVGLLRGHGEVLTEHVATIGEEDLADTDIFARDVEWLTSCDVVVAEVTTPSLGVGYEIGVAVEHDIPVLCLFHPDAGGRLSAMLSGNPAVRVAKWSNIVEAAAAVTEFLGR